MMKLPIRTLVLALASIALASCNKPRVIPDDELADIFYDVYLTNAYVDRQGIDLDSMMLYEPIFEKYGYTVEDLHLTINSFSKRKSARLSDAVEMAIQRLELESDLLNAQVADLDTINAIARRLTVQRIYFDTTIRMRSLSDTARMKRHIPIPRAGEYLVEYYYQIDSTDKNPSHRSVGYFLDSAKHRSKYYTSRYRRQTRDKYSHSFIADSSVVELVLELCNLNAQPKRPHFTIDSLTVKYYLPREEALDSLTALNFGFRLLVDGFYTPEAPATAADSALYFALPPRIE